MTFNLAPHVFALQLAVGIYDRVMGRDGLILRPGFVSKAVLGRLRTGIRALEAFLKRILILMALEMEHDLVYVHKPEDLSRAKPKMPRLKKYSLRIYPTGGYAAIPDFGDRVSTKDHDRDSVTWTRELVPISGWMDRLDHLHAIAKDPLAKARRLAFTLARSRHGILMAPDEHPRLLMRWGTEPSAIHDAMAYQIIQQSKARPPPHPPPRRGPKPQITIFW